MLPRKNLVALALVNWVHEKGIIKLFKLCFLSFYPSGPNPEQREKKLFKFFFSHFFVMSQMVS